MVLNTPRKNSQNNRLHTPVPVYLVGEDRSGLWSACHSVGHWLRVTGQEASLGMEGQMWWQRKEDSWGESGLGTINQWGAQSQLGSNPGAVGQDTGEALQREAAQEVCRHPKWHLLGTVAPGLRKEGGPDAEADACPSSTCPGGLTPLLPSSFIPEHCTI